METTAEDVAAAADTPAENAGNGAAAAPVVAESAAAERPRERTARTALTGQVDELFAAVRRLEAFAAEEAKRVSNRLVPQVETRAKQNIWVSLLLALGLGLILGIFLTGGRRRD